MCGRVSRRAIRLRSACPRSARSSAIAQPGGGSSTTVSTSPSCSRTTPRSIPALFAALLDFAVAERGRWDYRASAGGGAGAGGRRRRPAGGIRLAEAPCSAAPGDRADRLARRRRAPAGGHRALRPAGRHLSADGLGDREHAAGRRRRPPSATCRARPGGTTVQRRRMGLLQRLHHEAMRPIYRAQSAGALSPARGGDQPLGRRACDGRMASTVRAGPRQDPCFPRFPPNEFPVPPIEFPVPMA